ncbi:MAG TPA: sugar ABC transporter permease [Ktedonobacteraceae bacterium]
MQQIPHGVDDKSDRRTHTASHRSIDDIRMSSSAHSVSLISGKGKGAKTRPWFDFQRRTTLQAYLFLLPSLLGLLAFLLIPVVGVAILSFFDWGLLSNPRFIGLQNYIQLIQSPVVQHSLGVTIYFVVLNVPLETILALLLALVMNRNLPGVGIFRVIYAVPWMATPVAMGIAWQWIFDPQYGALNSFLALFGIHGPLWLASQQSALPAVAIISIWGNVGYTMLFFLAGLQGVPEQLYEAAYIDGATHLQTFLKITLPLLNPAMYFVLVTNIIGSFQIFDTVYATTKGGPGDATDVLNYYIFRQAFQFFHAGYASALSMVLFVILMLVTLLQALYFHRRTTYDLS